MRGIAKTLERRTGGEGSFRCARDGDLLETGKRLRERNRGAGLLHGRLEGTLGELVAIDQRPVDQLLLSGEMAWKGGCGERQVGWDGLGGEDRGELGERDSMGLCGGLVLLGDVCRR